MAKDLFDDYFELPQEVQDIIDSVFDNLDWIEYSDLNRAIDKLKPLGYTFSYDLDAVPYDLRKIS